MLNRLKIFIKPFLAILCIIKSLSFLVIFLLFSALLLNFFIFSFIVIINWFYSLIKGDEYLILINIDDDIVESEFYYISYIISFVASLLYLTLFLAYFTKGV